MEQVLLFEAGGERFALAVQEVREVLRALAVTPLPDAPRGWLGVIDLRGTLVPVCHLAARVGLPARAPGVEDYLVVTQVDAAPVALWVERVLVVKPREEVLPTPPVPGEGEGAAARAVIRTADGLVLILDLELLLAAEERDALAGALRRHEAAHG